MIPILIFFILHWHFSLFMQTAFLHRYAAHKMFTMSPVTEKVFFVLTWIFQGPHYLSAYVYGALHRMHHAYADTEKDPHSPSYDKSMIAMMWRTFKLYTNIYNKRTLVDPKFTKGLPEWDFFDQFASSWITRLLSGSVYIGVYLWFNPPLWMYALLPIQWVMGPAHGAIINWCAHKWGYRNFQVSDTSKNFLPLDLLMLGESYHNNHHAQPKNANFGVRFFEIDFTYQVLRILNWIGVIHMCPRQVMVDD